MYNGHMQNLKKKYNLRQMYRIVLIANRSFSTLLSNRIHKTVDSKFIERLMLATTEVNGCDVCSYAHTKMALTEGFSQEEINAFLSGNPSYINENEAKAILYAQHVADTMGNPDEQATRALIQAYGEPTSKIIQSAIDVMMMGNVSGIPLSAFLRRLKGKPYQNSSLFYELGMLLVQPFVFVIALFQALFFR